MKIKDRLSGNEATAIAMRQSNVDVMAAFPITPSTEISQYFSKFVADGIVDTEFIPVESEHSAMSACIGSQAAGARTTTATSSCGMALMNEMLGVASALRLPIVLACINRALTGPINIHCDHGDSMGARDCGWVQIYSENAQEAYDYYLMAYGIAEDKRVQLPVMICQDGFITSHAVENIELLDDETASAFVGTYHPFYCMTNPNTPVAFGPYDSPKYLMEHRRQQVEGMINAKTVFQEVAEKFAALSDRKYSPIECYKTEEAERIIIILGSAAGTSKDVVDELQEKGEKVGLIKIGLYRPFPREEVVAALKDCKIVAVMDRAETISALGGPVYADVCVSLAQVVHKPLLVNYIYGLGGRDVRPEHINAVFANLADDLEKGSIDKDYRYLALRELR